MHADGHWVAYFEGEISGSCYFSTCESNEELIKEMSEQLEKQLSLRCLCYGDGVWMVYFDGELQDDAQVQST